MRELVTYATNRIDLFCREHLGSDSDETRRRFIRWNYPWFQLHPTFWLPVGRAFWTANPLIDSHVILSLDGDLLVLPPGDHLLLPSPGVTP